MWNSFFIVNLIFNNMNKYMAFGLIVVGSLIYTVLNRILYQLTTYN